MRLLQLRERWWEVPQARDSVLHGRVVSGTIGALRERVLLGWAGVRSDGLETAVQNATGSAAGESSAGTAVLCGINESASATSGSVVGVSSTVNDSGADIVRIGGLFMGVVAGVMVVAAVL